MSRLVRRDGWFRWLIGSIVTLWCDVRGGLPPWPPVSNGRIKQILIELGVLPSPGGADTFGGIIYRPGAPSSGDFVATWAEVQAFVNATDGKCIVYIDDGIISPAIVPGASGVTDFRSRGELRPYRSDANNFATLVVNDGATLKSIFCIRSVLDVQGDCKSATPSFDFDYTPNVLGSPIPVLFLKDGAGLSSTATATQPACVIPANESLQVDCQEQAGFIIGGAVPLFHLAAATSTLGVTAHNGTVPNNFASGAAGNVLLRYNSETLLPTFGHAMGGVPMLPGFAGTYTTFQDDTQQVVIDVLASRANVLAGLLGGFLPTVGFIDVVVEGFGGSGGAGGGQGGSGITTGAGGGASGACVWQSASFSFNLAHQLDVSLGFGGVGGLGGAAGGAAGADGTDGADSVCIDATAVANLCSLAGSAHGVGGVAGVGGFGGSPIAPAVLPFASTVAPIIPPGGGAGGNSGQDGGAGARAPISFGAGVGTHWNGGAGGVSGGAGGGGGGSGAGPFGPGNAGGGPSVAGTNAHDNIGDGAGGGGGGTAAVNPGGNGGNGALGRMRLRFIAPHA